MTTQTETKPADITLQQLGGSRRLKLMIGAKDFLSDDNGNTLVFKFKKGPLSPANYVRITLTPADLYDVEFKKIGRLNKTTFEVPVETTDAFKGIGSDNLKDLFENTTGLFLTL